MGTAILTTLVVGSAHPLWLRGFLELVQSLGDVHVAGAAMDADGFVELLQRHRPSVVAIDAALVAAVRRRLAPDVPVPRILVFGQTDHAGTRPPFGAYCSCGYFSERDVVAKIAALVDKVARCALPHAGLDACASCLVPRSLQPPALPLTEREREVFVRIGWGLGPSEIATELGIHVKTVETHRESVKRKLGIDSATDLLDAAFKWRDGASIPLRRMPACAQRS